MPHTLASTPSPTPPVVLTIAGSDSSGGAGIQADLKTFAALGCYGASALTAITAQNTTGVAAAQLLDPALIEQQIEAVASDLPIAAIKTGMLGSAAIIEAVAGAIEQRKLFPFVLDPVMVAKSGDSLIDAAAVSTLVERLLPLATVVTPNRHEAARLLGATHPIDSVDAATVAAERICHRYGARACVVKAIRRSRAGAAQSVDVCFDGRSLRELAAPWRSASHTHGSGCAFSAALAALLALGQPLPEALDTAKRFIDAALASELRLGQGNAPVNPLAWLGQQDVL